LHLPTGHLPIGRRDAFAFLFADSRLPYLFALCGGIALAVWLIPPDVMLAGPPCAAGSECDIRQHIIGQRYFIADSWHWKLLVARALDWPDGTNIAFTDSIPAMALVGRLLRPLLPPGGNLVLAWIALSYALQPAASVFALRGLGQRGLLAGGAVAVIAVSMHALLQRIGHPALCGQFLILLALGLYGRICDGPSRPALLAAGPLLGFTLLIHPYLLAMVAAVLAAAPLTLLLRRDRFWRIAAGGVGAGLAATGMLAAALGYFGAGSSPGLFGKASMNLVTPFRPSVSTLFPSFGGILDATGYQYEGANYLGAGGLVLAAVAVMAALRGRAPALRRHAGLLACCVALTLLALSNRIYAGHHLLADLGPAPRMLGQFQSSGRFFWPVGYAIVLAGVAAVARLRPRPLAAAFLAGAAALQFVDMADMRESVRGTMREKLTWEPETQALRPLLETHQHLVLAPRIGCGSGDRGDRIGEDLLLAASERAMPVNTMWAARRTRPLLCGDEGYATLQENEVRVYLPAAVSGPLAMADAGRSCGLLGRVAVCSTRAGDIAGLPPVPVPDITTGLRVPATSADTIAPLVWGWSAPGSGGTWSDGPGATIAGRLTTVPERPAELTLWGWAFPGGPDGRRRIVAFFNERKIADWSVLAGTPIELHVPLPADADLTAPFAIRLDFPQTASPSDFGFSEDHRRLGFLVSAYWIGTAPPE